MKFEICILAKFRTDVVFARNFMVLAQTSKQISSTELTSYEKKLRKQETRAFLHKYVKPVQKFVQVHGKLISLKKKTLRGLDLKNFKTLYFLGGVICGA